MKIEIKRIAAAGRSWGSPGNNFKTSAKYAIVVDGVLVGKLWAQGQQRFMDRAVWEIFTVNADDSGIRAMHTVWNGGKKAAVAWITANVEKFIAPKSAILARGNGTEFWRIGDQVFRVTGSTVMDVDGLPMSRRWECSLDHWKRFRSIYEWVSDV